ncbi:hypothetical protein [Phenylobacterium sp.]|nr:hypothetical protein [Phenylobacterium sp.]
MSDFNHQYLTAQAEIARGLGLSNNTSAGYQQAIIDDPKKS